MKKVLIYMQTSDLHPIGGPRGYIYNLKQELDKNKKLYSNGVQIEFIENGNQFLNKQKNKINNMKQGKIKNFLVILKNIIKNFLLLYGRYHKSIVELSKYDAVHFHSTFDMYAARDSLKNYHGLLFLTSHSPTVLSKEIYDMSSDFEKKYCKFIWKKLIDMDEYAFRKADYILFPCEESEMPYYNTWSSFKKIKNNNSYKFRYLLTGISDCKAKINSADIRKKYNIPQDAFLITYVGRHSYIKGYDLFVEIVNKLDKDVYVIVAGKIDDEIKHPISDHWIEVGWTDDPYSIIASADVFVLPNRETYFDLIMLEVLSLKQIIVASRTGGNLFFSPYDREGIFLFDTTEEAAKIIKEISHMPVIKREELKSFNRKLYLNYFTRRQFAENYINLYNELLNNSKKVDTYL